MDQPTVTLIVGGLGIGGTLGGVFLGQKMSQKWQRDQWYQDQRLKELRELLDAVSDSFRVELTTYSGVMIGPALEKLIVETNSNAMRTIRSRIFVADLVLHSRMELKWAEALNAYENTFDVESLTEAFTKIRVSIVNAALGSLGKLASRK